MDKVRPFVRRRKVSSAAPPPAERQSAKDGGAMEHPKGSAAADEREAQSRSLLSPRAAAEGHGHSLSGSFSLFHFRRFSSAGRKVEPKESCSEASGRSVKVGKAKKRSTADSPAPNQLTPKETPLTLDM